MTPLIEEPGERLLVFVSSTIGECADERKVAKNAIASLNFQPVLFEDVGARPYPPRDLYRTRIESSQVFVAIYKHSYGFVAPDMSISGIEDEFNLATARGVDRLIYVFADPQGRDTKLSTLIKRVEEAGVTVSKYTDPAELHHRVRDDVTAVVTARFLGGQPFEFAPPDAGDVLSSLIPDPQHRLRRGALEASFNEQLARDFRIVVRGPIGSGKTVFLTQLCTLNADWLYIDVRGLAFDDTLRRALSFLDHDNLQSAAVAGDEEKLAARVKSLWESSSTSTLVFDGVSDEARLADTLGPVISSAKHLVIIARGAAHLSSRYDFQIPSLTHSEIRDFVRRISGETPTDADLLLLEQRSKGNPLYLRFYAKGHSKEIDQTLKDLELREWHLLDPRAREIMAYVVLSPRPLDLISLTSLVTGAEGGPESIADAVSRCSFLLRVLHGAIEPVHDHLRTTFADEIRADSVRLGFYAARLGELLRKNGNIVDAFYVLDAAGQTERANILVGEAATEAAISGIGERAIPVFERQIEIAAACGDAEGQMRGLLAKAGAFIAMGLPSEGSNSLSKAQAIADESNDSWWQARVTEADLELRLRTTGRQDVLADVERLKERYERENDAVNAARLGIVLCVEYIANGEPYKARTMAQQALETFQAFGDEYGVRVAQFNLLSALSAIPSERDRSYALAQQLAEQIDPSRQPRERAMMCNVLTRRYRSLGNLDLAAAYATEAIEIGERLGDLRVVALNRINLGNIARDRGLLDAALIEYRRADQTAHAAIAHRLEAAANEVIASVLNEKGEYPLAIIHADHAISLTRDSTDQLTYARSLEERGIATELMADYARSIDAYTTAAKVVQSAFGNTGYFSRLYLAAVRNCIDANDSKNLRKTVATIAGTNGRGLFEELRDSLPHFASHARPPHLLSVIATPFAFALRKIPKRMEQAVIYECLRVLTDKKLTSPIEQRLAAIIAVILACDYAAFSAFTLTFVAEQLVALIPDMNYKPHPDGAPHWTVVIPMSRRVLCSIDQLDDEPRVGAVAMLLALLLRTFASRIDELLGIDDLQRSEFQVNILSEAEFVTNVDPSREFLGEDWDGPFAVTESTYLTHSDQPPIVIILRPDFGKRWQPENAFVSDMHLLLGRVLEVAIDYLYARHIDPEILRPKLVSFIRSIGSKMDRPSKEA